MLKIEKTSKKFTVNLDSSTKKFLKLSFGFNSPTNEMMYLYGNVNNYQTDVPSGTYVIPFYTGRKCELKLYISVENGYASGYIAGNLLFDDKTTLYLYPDLKAFNNDNAIIFKFGTTTVETYSYIYE